MIIDGTDEVVALERNYFMQANEAYYLDQNDGVRLGYNEEQQQLPDSHQFTNETESSTISPYVSVRTIDRNIYAICEESTTILPKYGRVRIIKPITKVP